MAARAYMRDDPVMDPAIPPLPTATEAAAPYPPEGPYSTYFGQQSSVSARADDDTDRIAYAAAHGSGVAEELISAKVSPSVAEIVADAMALALAGNNLRSFELLHAHGFPLDVIEAIIAPLTGRARAA